MQGDYSTVPIQVRALNEILAHAVEKKHEKLEFAPEEKNALLRGFSQNNLDGLKFLDEHLKQKLMKIKQLFPERLVPNAAEKDSLVEELRNSMNSSEIDQYYKICKVLINNIDDVFNKLYVPAGFKAERRVEFERLQPMIESFRRFGGGAVFEKILVADPEELEILDEDLERVFQHSEEMRACYSRLNEEVNVSKFVIPQFLSRFIKYQTLGILDINRTSRSARISELKRAVKYFDPDHPKNPHRQENSPLPQATNEEILANLKFALVLCKMAKNPSKKDYKKMLDILGEFPGTHEPARLAKEYFTYESFKKGTKVPPKEIYDNLMTACANTGIEHLINKRDLKGILQIQKVAGSSKKKCVKALTSLLMIGAIPFVWTTALAVAVIAAIVYVAGLLAFGAFLVATSPIWLVPAWLISGATI